MKRSEVYAAIDSERDYQDKVWQKPDHNHSATEYLVYINYYVQKGFVVVSTENGEQGALPILRKIAALSVAAMEEHGAELRKLL
jgi:hypothetical protein